MSAVDHFLFNYVDNYNKKETHFPTEKYYTIKRKVLNRKSINFQIYADEQQRKKAVVERLGVNGRLGRAYNLLKNVV